MKMDKPRIAVARRALAELEQHRGFVDRHIGTTDAEQAEMLKMLGYASRSALIDAAVPPAIRLRGPLALPAAKGEEEALDELKAMARKNRVLKSYIGQGYYGTLTPGVILRNVLENPAWYTAYTPYQPEISQGRLEARGGVVLVAADPLALTLLAAPGEWGADVVVGSSQRFGVPMGFGGPHAAFFATRDEFKRSLPGRLVGVTIDANGQPAYRLALQTREQHIRREKATSNICTAQVLLAVIAAMYAVYHGPLGLATIAARIHRLTGVLAAGLERLGLTVLNDSFFDTLTVATGERTGEIHQRSADKANLRHID